MSPLTHGIREYQSVLSQAADEGWLAPLTTAHLTPCGVADAIMVLSLLGVPRGTTVTFGNVKQGKAKFFYATRTYQIVLPRTPSVTQLRVGLVLHEAAHVIDHYEACAAGLRRKPHGDTFCQVLRRLLTIDWRKVVPTSSYRSIYDNHRGPFCIMLIRETPKGAKTVATSHCLEGPYTAEDAHEGSRLLVGDPRDNVTGAYVFSLSEQQHIGAIYKRGEDYKPWQEEIHGRLDVAAEQPQGALLSERSEPVRRMDDLVDGSVQPAAGEGEVRKVPAEAGRRADAVRPEPGTRSEGRTPVGPVTSRKRGAALAVGRDQDWPRSDAAQAVKTFFAGRTGATPTEIIEALGAKLNEMGVAHPASLVSRLKQAGFLKEIAA